MIPCCSEIVFLCLVSSYNTGNRIKCMFKGIKGTKDISSLSRWLIKTCPANLILTSLQTMKFYTILILTLFTTSYFASAAILLNPYVPEQNIAWLNKDYTKLYYLQFNV